MKTFDKDALYEWRLRHDLTQEQAAQVLRVSPAALRKWEQGSRAIPAMVELLIERLLPRDFPKQRGSQGKRPIGVRERSSD